MKTIIIFEEFENNSQNIKGSDNILNSVTKCFEEYNYKGLFCRRVQYEVKLGGAGLENKKSK